MTAKTKTRASGRAGRPGGPRPAGGAPVRRLDRGRMLVLLGEAAVFFDRLYFRLAEAHEAIADDPAHPDRAWVDADRLAEVFGLLDDLADWLIKPLLVTPAGLPSAVADR